MPRYPCNQHLIPNAERTLSACALGPVPKWQHTRAIIIYVCVADLVCGHQPALLNASGLGLAGKNIALRSQKLRRDRSVAGFGIVELLCKPPVKLDRNGTDRDVTRSSRNPACYSFCSWAPSGSAVSCSFAGSVQEGMLLEGTNCLGE
jgi:hypothetical protein